MKKQSLSELEARMNYNFKNPELLRTALTHKSYAHQYGVESYERLEFLGDAILGFIIAQELYLNEKFPEGLSTRIRAALVCEDALAELAREININKYARLGTSAECGGERNRKSILADMFEAHIAALYLDAGLEETRKYVISVYGSRINTVITDGNFVDTDYKSRLQEKIQSKYGNVAYEVVSAKGPVHNCEFTIDAVINGKTIGTGISNSKKQAQQNAAHEALRKIKLIENELEADGIASDAHTILERLFKRMEQ